jgi:protoporphyrinogen oxidase
MGNRAWETLWQELFRKKFGKYAGNILASFIWARIKKRSKQLGYIRGGFQAFIDHLEKEIDKLKVEVKKGYSVERVVRKGKGFSVNDKQFDAVISTLPSPILPKITSELFSQNYLSRFNQLKFLHAVSLVFETKQPFLEKVYWLNVCVPDNKIMGIMQHTNFIDKKYYAGNHLLYVYNYVEFTDPRIRMEKKDLLKFYLPELRKINPRFKSTADKTYIFKGPFAQPVFDKQFLSNKPDFETPVKNFYIANLDMTYPYDRGTNYAVKLGKEVAKFF